LTQSAVLPLSTHCFGGMQVIVATHIVRSALQLWTVSRFAGSQREAPAAQVGGVHVAVDGLQSAADAHAAPLCQVPATHV
jgi:hypothetical protein